MLQKITSFPSRGLGPMMGKVALATGSRDSKFLKRKVFVFLLDLSLKKSYFIDFKKTR
jgi:hypothetical protein